MGKTRTAIIGLACLALILTSCGNPKKVVSVSLRHEATTCKIGTVTIGQVTGAGTTYTLNLNDACKVAGKWLAAYSVFFGGKSGGFYNKGMAVPLKQNRILIPEINYRGVQVDVDFIFFPHSLQVPTVKSIAYYSYPPQKLEKSSYRNLPTACVIRSIQVSDATPQGTDFTLDISDGCRIPGQWRIAYDMGFSTKHDHLLGTHDVALVGNVIHIPEFKYVGNASAFVEFLFFPRSKWVGTIKTVQYQS